VKGSLSIDVKIPGVGRIHRRSGVHTERQRRALIAMLQELPKRGFRELVVQVQRGERTMLAVYGHYAADTLSELAGPRLDRPLAPLLRIWLEQADVAESTRQFRRDGCAAVQKHARRGATLAELPAILAAYRDACVTAGTPSMFNRTRSALQAFVRDRVGHRKALWHEVTDVRPMRERKQGGQGYTVAEALTIRDRLASKPGRIWWGMCLTGMNPKEYWGDWTVHPGERIHVAGTKRPGRVRDVPLVDLPTRPELARAGFRSALQRLGERVTPKLARKTFDRWMQDAGVPRVRRKHYLGHGKRDVTDDYEWYEVVAYLREDAGKMRALLPQLGLRVEK
jgi:hypothetical protein